MIFLPMHVRLVAEHSESHSSTTERGKSAWDECTGTCDHINESGYVLMSHTREIIRVWHRMKCL